MSTDSELRLRVAASAADVPLAQFREYHPEDQYAWFAIGGSVLAALNIPPDVLSWVSANPEAAKGLAEGTMVAINKPPAGRSVEGHVLDYLDLWSFDKFKPDAAQYALIQSRQRVRAAFDDLRASTPAPSGKRPDPSPGMDLSISNDDPASSGEAQGEKPDDGVRYNHEGEPWPT